MDAKAGIDTNARLEWAKTAFHAAAQEAAKGGQVPTDLVEPDGWRWRVLDELAGLSTSVERDYANAKERQESESWTARFAGPWATGGSAAAGAIVSAVGSGVIKTSNVFGVVVVIAGVLFAFAGSIFSATNYVRDRNQSLRFLRLLYDIWDYAYIVLPSAAPEDVFSQMAALRTQWETAGG
jgi:hypothetical protein